MGDPATRRARNVVFLVIALVAIPSLILTALATVAVRNEEEAAKRRVRRLYQPVIARVAKDFNRRFETMLGDTESLLAEVIEADAEGASEVDDLTCFQDSYPFATNFFVLSWDTLSNGEESTRSEQVEGVCHLPDGCFEYPPKFGSRRSSCASFDRVEAVDRLLRAECAGFLSPKFRRLLRDVLLPGPVGAPVAVAAWSPGGDSEHDAAQPRDPPPEALQDVREEAQAEHRAYVDRALALARGLTHPLSGFSEEFVGLVGSAVTEELRRLPIDIARPAIATYVALSSRPELMEAQKAVVHPPSKAPAVSGQEVAGWRRVVVSLTRDGTTAGFELVPTVVHDVLEKALREEGFDPHLGIYVGPSEVPRWWAPIIYPEYAHERKKEDYMDAVWVGLSKTNLNWMMSLHLLDKGSILTLAQSRSSLYLWSLVLMAGALVVGITYLVRSIMAEARLSRLKTDFVSSVSHDLRTPLTSIRMFSEMLRDGRVDDRKEQEEFLQIIVDEAERLSRLTERILDFSRMEAGRKAYTVTPTEVRPLIQHALCATKPMIDSERFTVHMDVPANLPRICVDQDSLIEVFVNLISNAIKYSPEERSIVIRASASEEVVAVEVQDRGIGIPAPDMRKIFEKFYRVNNQRTTEVGGSGIGLSLVSHIVAAHGGTVTVESALGRGSTFTVRLPIAPAEGLETECVPDVQPEEATGGLSWRASS
ncbi:MAG: sensor histidine kinase [Myxococcota bacterium]